MRQLRRVGYMKRTFNPWVVGSSPTGPTPLDLHRDRSAAYSVSAARDKRGAEGLYLLPMGTLLLNMTQTSQSHRLPFHRALYPMPRGLVARIRAAVAEWLDREPVNLDELDRRFR